MQTKDKVWILLTRLKRREPQHSANNLPKVQLRCIICKVKETCYLIGSSSTGVCLNRIGSKYCEVLVMLLYCSFWPNCQLGKWQAGETRILTSLGGGCNFVKIHQPEKVV